MEITISSIDSKSKYLEKIQELGRKNSRTLGFMPEGGFIGAAEKGWILVAIDSRKECVGYLMYRVSTSNFKATIVHLCTDEKWRRMGIARQLVEYLITITRQRQLYTIEFSCRRDYNLSGMWSSFTFIPKRERKGRSKEGYPLTVWQLEHECPQLIKIFVEQKISSKIKAALDANIFFDFITDDRESKESKYLLEDWLLEEVELCLTDEIFVEIDRNQDSSSRESARKYANSFTLLPSSDIKIIYLSLCQILSEPKTEQDKSDLRQLARAITSEAEFFITRDDSLLKQESQIYEEFKIQVLRPTDLIIELDKSFNNFKYQPARLAGTTIEKNRVERGDYNQIIDQFLMTNLQEKKANFKANSHDILARPDRYDCFLVKEDSESEDLKKENNFIAFWVFDWQASNYLHIPIFRIKNNLKNANVILKHLIKIFLLEAASNNRELTKITDKYLALLDMR